MSKINSTDILFATLTKNGMVMANMMLSGLSSVAEVVHALRMRHAIASGMARLSIRNTTQGWASSASLYLR